MFSVIVGPLGLFVVVPRYEGLPHGTKCAKEWQVSRCLASAVALVVENGNGEGSSKYGMG
jgi:hypothetical protein